MAQIIISHSEEETIALGEDLGKRLTKGSIVCFRGDLGAGKTTFIKGLVKGAADCHPDEVNSPTFVYLNIYEGEKTIYHFDLYRLQGTKDFIQMGFDEMLVTDGISCIEWSERIASLLPADCIQVKMNHDGNTKRHISIEGTIC